MKKRVVALGLVLMVVTAMSAVAFAQALDVAVAAGGMLPLTCISKAQLSPILDAIVPESSAQLAVAGACVTKGELAAFMYTVLGLPPSLLESLFGVSEGEKLAIAQRNSVMVIGSASESITGTELAAILIGYLDKITKTAPLPAGLTLADLPRLMALETDLIELLPPTTLQVLMPGLTPVPTS